MENKNNEPKYEKVYKYTYSKLKYLESLQEMDTGKGVLANLRRGVGRKLGETPELWGLVFDGCPEELLGKRNFSNAEWSIYTALTLYALHQQGNSQLMNCYDDTSLGKACRKLAKDDDEERILNRLNLVVTAISKEDISYHLRGIVQLLSNNKIPLDYSKLAKQLYLIRNSDYSESIKLSWGRDFYPYDKSKNEGDNKDEQ